MNSQEDIVMRSGETWGRIGGFSMETGQSISPRVFVELLTIIERVPLDKKGRCTHCGWGRDVRSGVCRCYLVLFTSPVTGSVCLKQKRLPEGRMTAAFYRRIA